MAIPILLAIAAPVAATAPERTPAPLPDTIVDDSSCSFVVLVTFPVNDESDILFTDAQGNPTRLINTGHLVATFTNTETGSSYTANISGPTHIDFINGTFTQNGLSGGPVLSQPGLYIFAGRLSDGTAHGRILADVCALLAP